MEIYLDQENYDKVQSEFERKLLKEPKKNYPKYINKAINYKQKYRNHDTTNAQHYSAKDWVFYWPYCKMNDKIKVKLNLCCK